jgi:uncharacterized membrane protein
MSDSSDPRHNPSADPSGPAIEPPQADASSRAIVPAPVQSLANGTRHPVNVRMQAKRASDVQLRIADAITKFAGSMAFVYLHIGVFAVWMVFIEVNPWPTLTLAVSLEAIFLSTFVMIGQNRQSAFQQAKADHDFVEQELRLKRNIELTEQIHTMITEIDRRVRTDGRELEGGAAG